MNRAAKKTIHDELDLRGEPMAAPPLGLAEAIRSEIPERLNLAGELAPEIAPNVGHPRGAHPASARRPAGCWPPPRWPWRRAPAWSLCA